MKKETKSFNEMVLQILYEYRDRYITNAEISRNIFMNSFGEFNLEPITIREVIKNLRFGGHPIIANNKGYKLTTSEKELQEYVASRKKELESELDILRKMEGKG